MSLQAAPRWAGTVAAVPEDCCCSCCPTSVAGSPTHHLLHTRCTMKLSCSDLHGWQTAGEVWPRWVHNFALRHDNNCAGPSNICQQQCAEVVDDPGLIAAGRESQ